MSNKEHKKHPYLLKDLKISHKKSGVGNRYHLYSYGKRFMYLTAIIDLHTRFVLNWSVSNTMSADYVLIFCKKLYKSMVPEIFNTDQKSHQ
jgi:putative transposase